MQNRLRHGNALQGALRQGTHRCVQPIADAKRGDQLGDPLAAVTPGHPVELAVELERLADGQVLIEVGMLGREADARAAFDAPFALLSGGSEPDQILNYGNATALQLWERTWAEHTRTPSRLTAEPMERAAREEFLRRVRSQGFVDDYTGVRISSTGRRFLIENAIVWNLVDPAGNYTGQAATFPSWTPLD